MEHIKNLGQEIQVLLRYLTDVMRIVCAEWSFQLSIHELQVAQNIWQHWVSRLNTFKVSNDGLMVDFYLINCLVNCNTILIVKCCFCKESEIPILTHINLLDVGHFYSLGFLFHFRLEFHYLIKLLFVTIISRRLIENVGFKEEFILEKCHILASCLSPSFRIWIDAVLVIPSVLPTIDKSIGSLNKLNIQYVSISLTLRLI